MSSLSMQAALGLQRGDGLYLCRAQHPTGAVNLPIHFAIFESFAGLFRGVLARVAIAILWIHRIDVFHLAPIERHFSDLISLL